MATIAFGVNKETGKEVHIDEATKKEKYVCAWCKQPLIVNDGPVMGKFFRHFRPDDDCILIEYGNGNHQVNNEYNEPNDGIHQHFPEWMAYLRALKQGEEEKAATLWDFDIEVVLEDQEIHNTEDTIEGEETTSDIITSTIQPISFDYEPLFDMEDISHVADEHTNKLVKVVPVGDDIEWYSHQAMLKPILSGVVKNCPMHQQKTVTVSFCEECNFFMEFRQPTINPEKPNIVVCQGHHSST